MPTVLVLDNSLSMEAPACTGTVLEAGNSNISHRKLMLDFVESLMKHILKNFKLEYISVLMCSYSVETVVPFTRDLDILRDVIDKIAVGDSSNVVMGLLEAKSVLKKEWDYGIDNHVILVTDGRVDTTPASEDFPFKLSVVVTSPSSLHRNWQPLLENAASGSSLYQERVVTEESGVALAHRVSNSCYAPCKRTLCMGHHTTPVVIFPPVEQSDMMQDKLEICGFLSVSDVNSIPCVSRHILLPSPEEEPSAASFHVLLHGALKFGSYVAVTQLLENWFALIHTLADSKKKHSLVMSILQQGTNLIAWLGNLSHLALISDFDQSPYTGESSPFPLTVTDQLSYQPGALGPLWIQPDMLKADMQKVVRMSKRLPDKLSTFLKELLRVRRLALATDVAPQMLAALSSALMQELPVYAKNPSAATKLKGIADWLNSPSAMDIKQLPP